MKHRQTMGYAAWLVAPYLSTLVFCRWRTMAGWLAGRTALTLPVGWIAVLALLTAVLGVWRPPVLVMALCGALSGLAMIVPRRDDDHGRGGDDDGGGDPPPPPWDWDAFDAARRRWAARPPSGVV